MITESIAIMAYLERAFPEPPLFGETALETGLIWQRIFEFVNGLRNLIDEGVVRPLSHGTKGDGSVALKASTKAVHAALAKLEGVLQASDYLAGIRVSAADFTVIPNLQMLLRLGSNPSALALELEFDEVRPNYPAIAKWLARLEVTPAYQASYPPHWRLTPPG